jgi:tripartite-type tricarboxylate transporter receptor subunit TctC
MLKRILTGAVVSALACGAASAQGFPSRNITLVVPFPAGGTADLLCRYAGEKASAALGQQVVIENRPGGAGGRVGIEQVLRAPPDGYTLLCSTQLSYSITHLVFTKSSFDPRPLEPISVLATYPLVILVRANLPVSNLAEFNSYAKAGKINYGNQGIANTGHLLGALMELKGGYKMTPVFYRGSAPAINDLLAGTIDMVPDYLWPTRATSTPARSR